MANLGPAAVTAVTVAGSLQSVTRAMRLLELVAAHRDGVSAKQAAEQLEMALPSVYHLLATLTGSGYLMHRAHDHRYVLGYRVRLLEQGLVRQLTVPPLVAAAIRQTHKDADAAAYYAVYRSVEVVVAHVVDSQRRPRVQVLDVGFHEATHATAFGKVMLAAMDPPRRAEYLAAAGLRAITTRTITDRAELEAHLSQIRESGVALEVGEFQDGLSCLASPVRSSAGVVVGSVAISLPSAEFTKRRWPVERAVRHAAMTVTRAINASVRPA